MKTSQIIFAAFAIAVLAGGVWAQTTGSKTQNGASTATVRAGERAEAGQEKPAVENRKLTVYYFHGHVRCTNCIKFEHFTEELLKQDFAKDLEKGLIEWKVVNVDIPENAHFVMDYKLYTKSVVLVPHNTKKRSNYKNLTKIWQYAGDKAKFQEYVREEIRKVLGEGK